MTGHEVWLAWQQVRENRGAPGVDGQSIAAFEERLEESRRLRRRTGLLPALASYIAGLAYLAAAPRTQQRRPGAA